MRHCKLYWQQLHSVHKGHPIPCVIPKHQHLLQVLSFKGGRACLGGVGEAAQLARQVLLLLAAGDALAVHNHAVRVRQLSVCRSQLHGQQVLQALQAQNKSKSWRSLQ